MRRWKKQSLGSLTISVGVAAFPEHSSTVEELLKPAAKYLYESKSRGRDIVTASFPQKT